MALDNFRTQKIIWDRANKKIFEAIEANSGDSNGRKLVVQIINQEATENLSGTTLSLGWKSRNGAKGLDAFNIVDTSKGIFEIYYTTELLSNIGNIEASLILIDSAGRIESSAFTISVRPSTVDDESVESENSFTALTEALVKVNDFDAQLAQKADQDKVWGMANMGQDVKTAMTGGSVAVVGPASTDTINLLPNAVTPNRTSFLDESSNIFNHNTTSQDKTINATTGDIVDSPTNSLSEPIFVTPGEVITTNRMNRKAFYSGDGEFISSDIVDGTWTVPDGAYILRLVYPTAYVGISAQANRGNTLLPFELWKPATQNHEFEFKEESIDATHLKKRAIGVDNTNFVRLSSNLFNKKTAIKGHSINAAGYGTPDYGKIIKNSPYAVSEMKSITKGQDYIHNAIRVFFYDENGEGVNTVTDSIFNTNKHPLGNTPQISSFRIVTLVENLDTTQVNVGSNLLPYEDYYIEIDNTRIEEKKKDTYNLRDTDYYVKNVLDVFKSPSVESASETSGNYINSKSANDINALYDSLPDLTKTQIATDGDGNAIFRYDSKSPHTSPGTGSGPRPEMKKPKMVIIGGTHGNERMAVWTLYQTTKLIQNSWRDDPILESLKWDVDLVVIPVLNPSGWNANERKNGNGVDINRNFPTDWIQFEEGHTTYGGSAPLTEPEAIAVNNIIENEENVIYLGDFHNFGTNQTNFLWNAGGTLFNSNIGETFVTKMSRFWKKELPYLADDNQDYYGYVTETPLGTMALHAGQRGIHASTFEIGHTFIGDTESYSAESTKRGVEALVNWLYLNLINNIDKYEEV